MKTRVVVIDDLRNPVLLDAKVSVPKIEPIVGYSIIGGKRKFIVLRNPDEAVLVVGPLLKSPEYYHAELVKASMGLFGEFKISGGGELLFKNHGGNWAIEFTGRSGDYGSYDPSLLEKESIGSIKKAFGTIYGFFQWTNDANYKFG
jgi:hypothetical protein